MKYLCNTLGNAIPVNFCETLRDRLFKAVNSINTLDPDAVLAQLGNSVTPEQQRAVRALLESLLAMTGITAFGDTMNKSRFTVLLNNEPFMVIPYCESTGRCSGVVNYHDKFIGNITLKKGAFTPESIQRTEASVLDFQRNNGRYAATLAGFHSVFDAGADTLPAPEGHYTTPDYTLDAETLDIDSVAIDYFPHTPGALIIWDISPKSGLPDAINSITVYDKEMTVRLMQRYAERHPDPTGDFDNKFGPLTQRLTDAPVDTKARKGERNITPYDVSHEM